MRFKKRIDWVIPKMEDSITMVKEEAVKLDAHIRNSLAGYSILATDEQKQRVAYEVSGDKERLQAIMMHAAMLERMLETLKELPCDEMVEVDTGDDRLWLMAVVS